MSEITPTSEIIGQLSDVLEALEKRDSDRAPRLMESHVKHFIDKIMMQIL